MTPRGPYPPPALPIMSAAAGRPGTGWLRGPRALPAGSTLPIKLAGAATVLLAWELLARGYAPRFVARPTGIVAALPRVLGDPAFLLAAWATLSSVLGGLVLALLVGTAVGLAMGRVRWVYRFLTFYVNGLYAMPMVAILPLFALWFGFSGSARLAVVIFAAFFPIALNASDGARAVPPEYLEVGRSYRARWQHLWLGITLPAALPYLLAGVRLAAGRALVGAIVAEFYVSIEGLGFFILFQTRTFHHNEAFVAVLMLAAFGVGFDALMNGLTQRCLPWYRRETHTA
jgi:NitT/TauT family transport system permease protein